MKKFFTSPIGIIITLGVAVLIIWAISYLSKNKSTPSSTSNDFPGNPKDGDTFIKGGIKYTWSCLAGGGIIANPCTYKWRTYAEIKMLSMSQRVASTLDSPSTNDANISRISGNKTEQAKQELTRQVIHKTGHSPSRISCFSVGKGVCCNGYDFLGLQTGSACVY